MITITEKAQQHLRNIADSNPGKYTRLGIRGGGCAGFSYDWGLVDESEVKDDDEKIEFENGALVVDGTSLMYLLGTTVDLKADVFGTMLEIVNPAAQSSCGCGESINFDMDKVEQNMSMAQELKIPE